MNDHLPNERARSTIAALQTTAICTIIPRLARNPHFLALFEPIPSRTPTLLANYIICQELERLADEEKLDEEQQILWRRYCENRYLYSEVRRHLIQYCPLGKCSVSGESRSPFEDLEMAELKSRIAAVIEAVKNRQSHERRQLDMTRDEKRRSAKREVGKRHRRCYCVRTLASFEPFLDLLRARNVSTSWVDLAGGLVQRALEDYCNESVLVVDDFDDKQQPGKALGDEVLFHLFGSQRDGKEPCVDCNAERSVESMAQLLQQRLALSTIDIHFQRPLDSDEQRDVNRMRRICYDRALESLMTYGVFEELSSKKVDLDQAAAQEWVKIAGDALSGELEAVANSPVEAETEDADFDEEEQQRSRFDDPYADFLEGKCVDMLWDERVPLEIYLRDFAQYLDSLGYHPKWHWADAIRQRLEVAEKGSMVNREIQEIRGEFMMKRQRSFPQVASSSDRVMKKTRVELEC
ncbi:hypothetical protein BJ508DRAFT_413043 [Ascobolus immersus RN42]|uniref:Uncharacterized protein n=1 Tax=Ascobolus immersus RN42 TaxID=1160509 RepID=A0A3N4IEY9_ASCIM|nr:hypothetical protein BJ508DRAFT_413043 [Ascobolus immersus RN42]